MARLAKIATLMMLALLPGCVNFVSIKGTDFSRDIALSDADKIKPGMTEKQVVTLLGSPSSFGIDDQGREYLHYEAAKVSRIEGSVAVPFIGVLSTSAEIKGFVLNFYLKEGVVQGKSQYFYRAADKRKATETAEGSEK